MAQTANLKPANRFWLLCLVSLFLILYLSELLEASMFIDGVWYAVISNNLANGVGTLWHPQFSETIFSSFYEHPPLVFGIQSLFFHFFGDHFWTERLFSLVIYACNVWLIIAFWKNVIPRQSPLRYMWFLPLLFWQANIVNYFFLPANLLDTPLSILSGVAIYLMLRSVDHQRSFLLLVGAGGILTIAILTKGVVGLFPLSFIGLHFLLFRPYSFSHAIKRTLIVSISFLTFLILLFLIVPESWSGFKEYLEVQLFASLNGERRLYYYQSNRFYILGQLLWTLTPMIFATVAVFSLNYFLKLKPINKEVKNSNQYALLFLLTGLSASLPIMVSPRQALPYLIPSLPYFSLAVAVWMAPKMYDLMVHINTYRKRVLKVMEWTALSFCCMGLFLVIHKYEESNQRDYGVIEDAKTIGTLVDPKTIIGSTTYNMYISGYLMRYHQISLDTTLSLPATYLISKKEEPINSSIYEQLAIPTHEYLIYKRRSELSSELKEN